MPCPAPAGAVIPWEPSPPELALPGGRSPAGAFTSGETLYLVGGQNGSGATASVLLTRATGGNLSAWQEGPALPEPRAGAAVLTLNGVPYVVGGYDAAGMPTSTTFRGVVAQGMLTGWEAVADLALPVALADLSGVSTGTGMYIFGGRTANGLSAATYHSTLTTTGQAKLQKWVDLTELRLPEPRADASAATTGTAVFVIGGTGPSGVTNSVFYLGLDTHGQPSVNSATGRPYGWGVSVAQSASAALPEPRTGHTTFVNSGALYVLGGQAVDGSIAATNYWTVPAATDGTIKEWLRLDATDLPEPRAGAAAAVVGQYVYISGGSTGTEQLATTNRADLAPRTPYFRVGLFGLTIPALSIKGEIGQQLGYLVAGTAALGDFVLLVVVGWMFSHRPETFRFFRWITRGRFRPPPEDEYQS